MTIVTAAMLLTAPAVACKDDFDRVIQDEDQQDRLDWKFAQAALRKPWACCSKLMPSAKGRRAEDRISEFGDCVSR